MCAVLVPFGAAGFFAASFGDLYLSEVGTISHGGILTPRVPPKGNLL